MENLFQRIIAVMLSALMTACGSSCAGESENVPGHQPDASGAAAAAATGSPEGEETDEETSSKEETAVNIDSAKISMTIGDTAVEVEWLENDSVKAIKEMLAGGSLTIQMSMYGGFEQVGSLGQPITRNDSQTVTEAGDIVLYSGNQIVVFYGSNSWSYTRLGRITDKTPSELADLLGSGDVTITLSLEK